MKKYKLTFSIFDEDGKINEIDIWTKEPEKYFNSLLKTRSEESKKRFGDVPLNEYKMIYDELKEDLKMTFSRSWK